MDILTHPALTGLILALAVVLVLPEPLRRRRDRQRVNAIVMEGEVQKGSNGRSRDSRKQGAVPVESIIESSDRPKSGRSEGSMEEKDTQSRPKAKSIVLDRPRSLVEAQRNLEDAEASLNQARQQVSVHARGATAFIILQDRQRKVDECQRKVEECQLEAERRREAHNEVLIETRDRQYTQGGKVRSGRQVRIGLTEPRGAA